MAACLLKSHSVLGLNFTHVPPITSGLQLSVLLERLWAFLLHGWSAGGRGFPQASLLCFEGFPTGINWDNRVSQTAVLDINIARLRLM